jgi:hypothetical protein
MTPADLRQRRRERAVTQSDQGGLLGVPLTVLLVRPAADPAISV